MDAATVTGAALATLDEVGFDKLTMRGVATRLGVQVGGLYYHVPDKTAMVRSMADVLCHEIVAELHPSGTARADVLDLCVTARALLLRRRDAARVFAQSPLAASEGAIALMERLLGLLAGVVPERSVRTAGDTLLSYVTGYVLQEQMTVPPGLLDASTLERWTRRYPRVFGADEADADTQFVTAIDAIVDGFAG